MAISRFNSRLSPVILLGLFFGYAGIAASEPVPKNALYAQPILTAILGGFSDQAIVSVAYERSLTENGLALIIPLHFGFNGYEDENSLAMGMGIGGRKYIGRPFSGSYLTFQTDYVYEWDEYSGPISTTVTEDFVSITQLSFGYKWMWRPFILDMSLGGAFYATETAKHTNIIGNINFGFPFGKENFGL